jgi:RHS repeat-associated protein
VKSDEKVYVHERGRRILEFEKSGSAFEVSQRMLPDPTANRMLAEEGIEATGNVTIWPLHDHQGTVIAAYAASWHPGMDDIQQFEYDAFGQPLFDPTQDPSLANRLTMLHAGRDFDTDTKLYYNGSTWNDPASGRYLRENPATGNVNPYRYAGNSPANLARQGGADASWTDFFGKEFGYYVKPWNNDPGWGGYAFGAGKFLGWGMFVIGSAGAAALGGGTLMAGAATAAGKITLAGAATYTGVQAGISGAETGVEYAMADAFGADDFSFGESYLKNFGINFVTGGIGSKGKWLYRAGAWAGREGIEIGAETAYDVYKGRDFATSLAFNTAGSIGGEAIFRGLGRGWRAFDNNFEIVSNNGSVYFNTFAFGAAVPLRVVRRDARVTALMEAGILGARRLRAGTSGGDFQIDRAWHYFQRGELSRIEHAVGTPRANRAHRPRVDLRLTDATRVELKSWRGFDTLPRNIQDDMLRRLREQVPTYLGGRGRYLRVEFDEVVPDRARLILERLQRTYGDRLWFGAV